MASLATCNNNKRSAAPLAPQSRSCASMCLPPQTRTRDVTGRGVTSRVIRAATHPLSESPCTRGGAPSSRGRVVLALFRLGLICCRSIWFWRTCSWAAAVACLRRGRRSPRPAADAGLGAVRCRPWVPHRSLSHLPVPCAILLRSE